MVSGKVEKWKSREVEKYGASGLSRLCEQQLFQHRIVDWEPLAVTRAFDRLGQRRRQRNGLAKGRLNHFTEFRRMRGRQEHSGPVSGLDGQRLAQSEPRDRA